MTMAAFTTPTDLDSWRALARSLISDLTHAASVRAAIAAVEPSADAAITREALAVLCFSDPQFLLKRSAVIEWMARVAVEAPGLRLHAWLAARLYSRGLYDGTERDVTDDAPYHTVSYLDAIDFLFDREIAPSTPALARWLVWRCKREPEALQPVAIAMLERLESKLRTTAPSDGSESPTSALSRLAFIVRDAVAKDDDVPEALRAPLARMGTTLMRVNPQIAPNFIERVRRALPAFVDALLGSKPAPSRALLDALLSWWDQVTIESDESLARAIARAHSSALAELVLLGLRERVEIRPLLIAIRDQAGLVPALAEAIDHNDAQRAFALFYAVPFEMAAKLVDERVARRKPKRGSVLEEFVGVVEKKAKGANRS